MIIELDDEEKQNIRFSWIIEKNKIKLDVREKKALTSSEESRTACHLVKDVFFVIDFLHQKHPFFVFCDLRRPLKVDAFISV